ncbi:glycosyltransferase family 4 protein [Desulfurivibrio dismutans]|uniref:glycosyltransferase family 4 protein n=1 Tax=Desulfurivibrio dismutans TaxID=1398908 RepID=UPI0023DCB29D|nr:glycosyltransferase family 4 protein [Desulfurivibrio alkaliphilus]MDF1614766.1 glycosyltransferase family 4 protein [Desulfurivibrio alkaliphilus]
MRVLILVGRFHPNLTEWVAAFRQEGWSVSVIAGGGAVNRVQRVEPRIIPPKTVSETLAKQIAEEIQPDLVIIRSKSHEFRRIVRAARRRGASAIYYDQRPYLRPAGIRGFYREVRLAFKRARLGHPRVGITTTRGQGDVPRLWRHWVRVPMPVPDRVTERPYFRDGIPTVLMVGRLANKKKRHLWVLDALESFGGPYRLLVAGAGDDSHTTTPGKRSREYYEQVRKTLNAPQHQGKVQLLEDIPHESMPELYQQADIFVLPSTKELLGISIVEAMAQGCAVVASSGAGATGYMTDGKDGLIFASSSYGEFRDSLRRLLADADYTRSLGQNAATTIREHHRHADFVDQIKKTAGF